MARAKKIAPEEISVAAYVQSRVLRAARETTIKQITAFRKAHVDDVVIRSLLFAGMLCARIPDGKETASQRYLILIGHDLPGPEVVTTFFHELLHIQLLVAGVPEVVHDEPTIDDAAIFLANKFPDYQMAIRSLVA
jgi:hypothetical protein